ncbi:hypothetical protein B0H13DRAFT_2278907 [Mycena leptocephala]|nr:hypothetical protein B0H13DRAFT_2278907 [Mycena leptocephala]
MIAEQPWRITEAVQSVLPYWLDKWLGLRLPGSVREGILLRWKEMKIPFGVNPDDTFFQYVPSPILRGLLQSKPVLDLLDWIYDGSPFYLKRLLKFVSDQGHVSRSISLPLFEPIVADLLSGTARFLAETRNQRISPRKLNEHVEIGPFETIKTVSSAGAILGPMFAWTQNTFSGHIRAVGERTFVRHVRDTVQVPEHGNSSIRFKKKQHRIPGQGGELVGVEYQFIRESKVIQAYCRCTSGAMNPTRSIATYYNTYPRLERRRKESGGRTSRPRLFLKMHEGKALDDALVARIKDARYTNNGKRIQIAVKEIVSGMDTKTSGTIANPESLKLYYKYRDLEATLAHAEM